MKPRARGRAAAPASLPGNRGGDERGKGVAEGGEGVDKNKNTVSLVSKAGDVLTPVGDGVLGGGGGGMGPENLSFLEHGGRSVSCITGRLPFHTTMTKTSNFNISFAELRSLTGCHSVGLPAQARLRGTAQLAAKAP